MKQLGMHRLECLDGLRGLLAVYVLLGHMAPFAVLPDRLQSALSHGGAAVDVFFILSGLVITQSLAHANGQAIPFLINRVARIYPVFLLVFALAAVVHPWTCGFEDMPWIGPENAARTICVMADPHGRLAEILAHLTMTHGLFPNGVLKDVWVSYLGSAWSLSTEWQFYLLALLAFTQNRHLCWLLLGLAVAGLAWRLSVPVTWQFSRAFLPNKAQFFALGVASGPVMRRENGALVHYALVLTVTLLICATQHAVGKMLPPLVWTLCLAVQLRPERAGTHLIARVLRHPVTQYLGAISYCLYLVNEPIHKLTGEVLARVAGGNGTLFTLMWIPLATGLPILAAAWLHTYWETPALKWGRALATSVAAGGDRGTETHGPTLKERHGPTLVSWPGSARPPTTSSHAAWQVAGHQPKPDEDTNG
jgi:peptidoglycan/LPS O-acetylase OafA/YrhL